MLGNITFFVSNSEWKLQKLMDLASLNTQLFLKKLSR
jgi:hypothetical protein